MTPVMSLWLEMVPIRNQTVDISWTERYELTPRSLHPSLAGRRLGKVAPLSPMPGMYVSSYGCCYFQEINYWSYNCQKEGAKQIPILLFSFVGNSSQAGKIRHVFKAPLSPQKRDEQRWLSSYFFIRTGDGSSVFPESVRDQRAQRFIHHRSQLHRLFILLERPTSEARPIKFSHSCPDACHLAHINQNTLSFSVFLSLYPRVPFIFISPFLPPCPTIAPSFFALLMRSELVLKLWRDPTVKAANETHISELTQDKATEDVQGFQNMYEFVFPLTLKMFTILLLITCYII